MASRQASVDVEDNFPFSNFEASFSNMEFSLFGLPVKVTSSPNVFLICAVASSICSEYVLFNFAASSESSIIVS